MLILSKINSHLEILWIPKNSTVRVFNIEWSFTQNVISTQLFIHEWKYLLEDYHPRISNSSIKYINRAEKTNKNKLEEDHLSNRVLDDTLAVRFHYFFLHKNTNCINKTWMLWWRNFGSSKNLLENSIKVIKSSTAAGKTHLGNFETSANFRYVNFIELKGDGWILKKRGGRNETQQVYFNSIVEECLTRKLFNIFTKKYWRSFSDLKLIWKPSQTWRT